jgi:hypothetical protein
MAKMSQMQLILAKFCHGDKPVARLLTIYIEEGTPPPPNKYDIIKPLILGCVAVSGGGLNSEKRIASHHSKLSDRLAAATKFKDEVSFEGELVCESMTNASMSLYRSHPERICVLIDGVCVHLGGRGDPLYYDIDGVIDWLAQRFPEVRIVEEKAGGCSS